MPFDDASVDWLEPLRYAGSGRWGREFRATQHALVLYEEVEPRGPWLRYLALQRHGGIEYSAAHVRSEGGEGPELPLGEIVSRVWSLVDLQAQVCVNWGLELPGWLTVRLADLSNLRLGDFGSGWADPVSDWWGPSLSPLESTATISIPITKDLDPDELASKVGDRIENAFGSTARRYTPRGSPDQIDPRFRSPAFD